MERLLLNDLTIIERERLLRLAKSSKLKNKMALAPAIGRAERGERIPQSFAQQRLWLLAQMEGTSEAYHIPFGLNLEGRLNRIALLQALDRIVARHEALRTTFCAVDGEPVQMISAVEDSRFHLLEHDLHEGAQGELDRLIIEEAHTPFDLETGPLIRGRLIRQADDEHTLLITMHHIVSDGWSIKVLTEELSALYTAFVRGEADPLPELRLQYADYAVWQRKEIEGDILRRQADYWKATLAGAPALLELPADHARPAQQEYAGDFVGLVLDGKLTASLSELSKRHGTTLYITMLAAWAVLLTRLSGEEEVVIGTPVANRGRLEIEGLIGFFVNTLAVRLDLSGSPTIGELLDRVKAQALAAQTHQDISFEQVVEVAQPVRSLAHSPLFQVMFAWQNTSKDRLILPGLKLSQLSVPYLVAKFDLTLSLEETGERIVGGARYATSLFERATIERHLACFRTLLEAMVGGDAQAVDRLPIVPALERQQVLYEWNRTEVAYPKDRLLHHLIEEQVERTPNAVAVVFQEEQLTFRQLNDRSNGLAHYLQNLGVGPNVLVGICVGRSLEMLVGLLGILKAGGAYVPLDPAYPKSRLDFILDDTEARVVLTTERLRQLSAGCSSRVVCLDTEWAAISKAETANPRCTTGPNDLAYVIYTSGSTGQPKGVAISHRSPAAFVHWAHSVFSPEEMAGVLFSTSICFDLSVFEIFVPLSRGGKVILVADALHLRELPAGAKVTLVNTVPSVMKELIRLEAVPSSVRTINLAGEPLPVDLVQKIYELPHVRRVYDLYGPSETTTYSTFALRQVNGPSTIGRPIANTEIYILDSHLQPVPVGVTGELCIAGDGLARGYFNRPELTAEKFISNSFSVEPGERLYRTGDIARYLPDGNIEFLGRMDHQVKIRGFRIELGEIEAALKQHPGISQCVTVAREDSHGEKRLEAYIVPCGTRSGLSTSELRDFVKQKLPEYMVPAAFSVLERFPLTPNGKIDRKALTAKSQSEYDLGQPLARPETLIELHVQQIWESVLDVGAISIRDNFFNVGGHSLLAVRLINEINKSLSVTLTIQIFFLNPTIEGIARVLQGGAYAKSRPHSIPLLQSRSRGALFLLDATMAMCRLGQLLDGGPNVFATEVPVSAAAYRAALFGPTSDLPRLEEMAAAHVSLIRARHRGGPLLLAGHSFNGLLAFEVAHQLSRMGTKVEMILLVDSWRKRPPLRYRLHRFSWARARLRVTRGIERLRLQAGRVAERIFPIPNTRAALDLELEQFNQPFNLKVVKKIYKNARSRYQVHELEGRAVLFRSQDSNFGLLLPSENTLGWKTLFTDGLEYVDVPGDHNTLLEDPHLLVLAQKINERLAMCSWAGSQADAAGF